FRPDHDRAVQAARHLSPDELDAGGASRRAQHRAEPPTLRFASPRPPAGRVSESSSRGDDGRPPPPKPSQETQRLTVTVVTQEVTLILWEESRCGAPRQQLEGGSVDIVESGSGRKTRIVSTISISSMALSSEEATQQPTRRRRTPGGARLGAKCCLLMSALGVVFIGLSVQQVEAAIPDASGVIHGCYNTTNGTQRLIDPATDSCKQN